MDKQMIEEMARTLGGCHSMPNCKVCCAYIGSTYCFDKTRAERLYNAGYRKESDTAREILDEVSKHYGGAWLVELYKKYGLEGNNV